MRLEQRTYSCDAKLMLSGSNDLFGVWGSMLEGVEARGPDGRFPFAFVASSNGGCGGSGREDEQ